MGSPSLRTFKNKIHKAKMEAASFPIRRLFQVTEAARHPGRGKAHSRAGKHRCPLSRPRLCPSQAARRTWQVLALPVIMRILGIAETGGRGWGDGNEQDYPPTLHHPSARKLELQIVFAGVTKVELADSCGPAQEGLEQAGAGGSGPALLQIPERLPGGQEPGWAGM